MFDTIAAISSAVGEAGIGIVRLSGKDAINIANNIFKGINDKTLDAAENRKMTYGHIIDNTNNQIIDEVLIVSMKAPHTYTRENVVEIYCHGGIIPVKKTLELLLKNGARLAEPGEFTKRAFLNGRLDLSQAEAVIDIIRAKTNKSHEVSMSQLEGSLSNKVNNIRNIVLSMVAHVEVTIDFPEDDIEEVTYEELEENAKTVISEIKQLLKTADRGKILREGLNTVILGKPNVGKSSLLNAMLRENRAIVTDIPGTTRDIIEEHLNIDGIPLKIIDTAGIRETEDIVEKIGVDRAKESIESADLIIAIFDVSRDLSHDDFNIIELIKDKKSLVLLNKTDLPNKYTIDHLEKLLEGKDIITTSIVNEVGIDILEESIKKMFYAGEIELDSNVVVTNLRHKNQLDKALDNMENALNDIKAQVPLDCIEVDLRDCWENLGEISGDTISEDILDKIFSEFCIGK
ncbi:MAG: tRNA uridine-5-carboxymethylaminomethyl(34) synthesis GTPase MnmE [Tissierellaceae bacterium]|nr:tRNA uridine-5-carboxymethylaminomethyl(34) synthesis GTPase MnmE [Tissierellaceae bacterium]